MPHLISNLLPFLAHPMLSLVVTLGVVLAAPTSTQAKELDQFTDRNRVQHYYAGGYRSLPNAPSPAQVEQTLDREMNRLLGVLEQRLAASNPNTADARHALVEEVFQHPFVPDLVTPYEEWVATQAAVPLYRVQDRGIYGGQVHYDDMRMSWYIDLSPTLQLAGVPIGIDKLGHFLAQGFQYYMQIEHRPATVPLAKRLAEVRALGHRLELGSLGVATTGVYSFADLAANWQGMRFFASLFDRAAITGVSTSPYFTRDARGHYHRVRSFHWRDWMDGAWDEVQNPSHVVSRILFEKVRNNMQNHPHAAQSQHPAVCDHFLKNPGAFIGSTQEMIPRETYAVAGASQLGFPLDAYSICAP